MTDLQQMLSDEELLEDVRASLVSDELVERLRKANVDPGKVLSAAENLGRGLESGAREYEAIIRRVGRPVLYIQDDKIQEPKSGYWKQWITKAQQSLAPAIPSVGRIELVNHPSFDWIGTGWVVAPDVIVTNQHVAREFAHREEGEFRFAYAPDDSLIQASIDFKREHDRLATLDIRIRRVLYIEESPVRADIAFLQAELQNASDVPLPPPIRLAAEDVGSGRAIGCIGYAAEDSRIPDQQLMREIFADVYNVKRLHPGEIMGSTQHAMTHDASTLGGNSGSAVLDLETGEAVGLHFGGSFLHQNYAVKASTIRDRMARLELG